MKFVFKKKYADEEEIKASYTLRFLDMKFVIYHYSKKYSDIRFFAGFRDDGGDYKRLHDFRPPSVYGIRIPNKAGVPSEEEKITFFMNYIISYIQGYYNFDSTELIVVDEFLDMLENWLEM